MFRFHDFTRHCICAVSILAFTGCPQSPPSEMTDAQKNWADSLIENFHPSPLNLLPASLSSPGEIVQFLEEKYSVSFICHYEYKGFIILPIRLPAGHNQFNEFDLSQLGGVDFSNIVLVGLNSRSYQFIMLAKT